MAKINRYDGNLVPFAINATGTNRTIFGSVSQSDELTANIDDGSWRQGWEIVGPSDKPTIEDFSGATFTNAQLSAYLHQMGVAEWNDKQEYQIGSIANRAGVLYSCLTPGHIGLTPPESDGVNWKALNYGRFVGDYDDILPLGQYASGSYTISNGRQWSDFDLIIMMSDNEDAVANSCSNSVVVTREFIDAYPASLIMSSQSAGADGVVVTANSATQFTISRSGNDQVRHIIGYRRQGVA